MQGGPEQADDGVDSSVVPAHADLVASSAERSTVAEQPLEPMSPLLPRGEAKPPPPMMANATTPMRGAETWYRTDQDRYKSVHRRANPWYRRLARGLIGLSFFAAFGVGLYFAAQIVQDVLDRDRLPGVGLEVPVIRATSFEIRSSAPAPLLDGTLTLDTASRAFEYLGRGTGAQAGTQVVSPDGTSVYVRRGTQSWQLALTSDPVANDVTRAVAYLADDDSADDILTIQLRRGYIDLQDRTKVGTGDDALTRYAMTLDTASFQDAFPLQYGQFRDSAIPGVQDVRALPVTIWLDNNRVLVRLEDLGTNWSWERLTYSDQPFTPLDPLNDLLTNTIEIQPGTLGSDDG